MCILCLLGCSFPSLAVESLGSGAGRAGYSSSAVCDSLTCTLIGSCRNLLSWMLCAWIGSSLQRQRKWGREGGGQRLLCTPVGEKQQREEEWERREGEGEYPSSSDPLCYCSPPPSLGFSFFPFSPYSSVSLAALRGRTPAAPWWFSLSAAWSTLDKAACPSCHCSARPACPWRSSYCSRPITSTPPLLFPLPKCSGESQLLFYRLSRLNQIQH